MECLHISRILCRWVRPLTPCLLLGLGCYPQASLPLVPGTGSVAAGKDITPEKDLPKRKPAASTCVAFGDLELRGALDATRTPVQKEQALEMARCYYQQAIKTDAKCLDAYVGLARTYEELGDQNAAVTTYQKGLKVFPKRPGLWYDLGMCEARHKEWGPAVEHLQKASDLDPDNRIYSHMLAYTLARAGRCDESFACFRKTLGEAQAHYNVARMLHHLHQDDACQQRLQQALQADPTLKPAKQLLARLNTPAASIKTAAALSPEEEDLVVPASGGGAPNNTPPKY
jgi:Tfp pilus assembly protein PilF